MRNWNLVFCPFLLNFSKSFHSTYEELKQRILHWNRANDICFHSTYEELKLATSFSLFPILIPVFILPMRNWNSYETPFTNASQTRFSFYLWGIETPETGCFLERVAKFSFYLWGIETIFKNLGKAIPITTFSFYLWGIETRIDNYVHY